MYDSAIDFLILLLTSEVSGSPASSNRRVAAEEAVGFIISHTPWLRMAALLNQETSYSVFLASKSKAELQPVWSEYQPRSSLSLPYIKHMYGLRLITSAYIFEQTPFYITHRAVSVLVSQCDHTKSRGNNTPTNR